MGTTAHKSDRMLLGALFVAVLAIANANRCSNKNDIELYERGDRSKFHCWPAVECNDGYQGSVEAGSSHPKGTVIECSPCPNGSFSNLETNHRCHTCTSCGNKQVLVTCTPGRDGRCSNSCLTRDLYFNATDQQCHPCSECCGTHSNNIEPQCLTSMEIHVGVTVIGGRGDLHCKVKSAQRCDDLLHVQGAPEGSNPDHVKEKDCKDSTLDTLHIVLICLLATSVIIMVAWSCCWIKGRCFSPSCRAECPDAYEMTSCMQAPFKEKLKLIPEDVKIDSIPFDVEECIKKLDAKKYPCKNWYHVGRKLGVSNDDLDEMKRDDDRQGGSPTRSLLSVLCTAQNVLSLRAFVQVLHDLKRNDIANGIFAIYQSQVANNDSNV